MVATQIFFVYFHPEPREDEPSLTSIFFRWVAKNHHLVTFSPSPKNCRVPKGGVFKGGGNWGTLRIPFGKIGEP